MSSNRLKLGVAGALLLGGVAAILFEHHVSARLLEENDRLMEEGREFASLRQENARLKKETASLTANLHAASAAALTAAHDRAAGRAGEGAHGGFPLAPGLVSIRLLGNAGRGSPRAAFQTQLWAARNGDIDLTASALTFGPEARAKLEALLAQLPQNLRDSYGTPELLMAYMLAGSPHPMGGMQVLGEEDESPDTVVLHTQWQHEDDSVVHDTDAQFQRADDGWRLVIPVTLVDRAGAYLLRHAPR